MTVDHGTRSGYAHHGCRCGDCTKAQRAYMARYTARLQRRLSETDVPHGSWSTYNNWGCRCDACKAAGSAKNAANYARRKQARASAGAPPTPPADGAAIDVASARGGGVSARPSPAPIEPTEETT